MLLCDDSAAALLLCFIALLCFVLLHGFKNGPTRMSTPSQNFPDVIGPTQASSVHVLGRETR